MWLLEMIARDPIFDDSLSFQAAAVKPKDPFVDLMLQQVHQDSPPHISLIPQLQALSDATSALLAPWASCWGLATK